MYKHYYLNTKPVEVLLRQYKTYRNTTITIRNKLKFYYHNTNMYKHYNLNTKPVEVLLWQYKTYRNTTIKYDKSKSIIITIQTCTNTTISIQNL
jgi:hypothetical protein